MSYKNPKLRQWLNSVYTPNKSHRYAEMKSGNLNVVFKNLKYCWKFIRVKVLLYITDHLDSWELICKFYNDKTIKSTHKDAKNHLWSNSLIELICKCFAMLLKQKQTKGNPMFMHVKTIFHYWQLISKCFYNILF